MLYFRVGPSPYLLRHDSLVLAVTSGFDQISVTTRAGEPLVPPLLQTRWLAVATCLVIEHCGRSLELEDNPWRPRGYKPWRPRLPPPHLESAATSLREERLLEEALQRLARGPVTLLSHPHQAEQAARLVAAWVTNPHKELLFRWALLDGILWDQPDPTARKIWLATWREEVELARDLSNYDELFESVLTAWRASEAWGYLRFSTPGGLLSLAGEG